LSEPHWQSAAAIAAAVNAGSVSAVEVVERQLQRIEAHDGRLGAYLRLCRDEALEQARGIDRVVASGQSAGPLAGVPVGLKDVVVTRGIETTAGSKILAGWKPVYDATIVERLRAAGAVFVGKLNMDEFAMGSSNENSAYKPCRNPWDLARVPGGSSGGAAAAISAGLCAVAIGTDTGGSIRQPASLCGCVGLRPTYGRVSRHGIIAYASSLDQVGPLARTVEDCALALNVLAGGDPRDATSVDTPVPDYLAACGQPIAGLRVGVPEEFFAEGLDPEVERVVRAALQRLSELGAIAVPISLPHTQYGIAAYYLVATAEASSNLARYDGLRYGLRLPGEELEAVYRNTRSAGFGAEVKLRILLGTYALRSGYYDAYYLRAQKVRALIKRDFDAAFAACDVVAAPVSPVPAFRIGEKLQDPLAMYLADVYTVPCNLAGLPGLSVPCGFTAQKLPVGLQLLGPAFGEAALLRVAAAYQAATDWHLRRPPFAEGGAP
jgi:aspartyl-tRNA(Asn)/glutamyl-tRNA(Gln) amidotransferase subunit A